MRVLLVAANTERSDMVVPPYGLGLVAGALRALGHDVAFLDLLSEADPRGAVIREVRSRNPGAVGISIRNLDDQNRQDPRFLLARALEVVGACREATSAPVILGGPGFSILPAQALAFLGADYGVRGDGEEAFPALLEALEAGRDPCEVPGVLAPGRDPGLRAAVADLDAFAPWDPCLEGTLDPAQAWVPVQARRGCPNDCSYCATWAIQGRAYRIRDPRRVVAAVADLAARGYRQIFFVDNAFNLPEGTAFELCAGLEALDPGVKWRCILYPHAVREDLVRAMARAGCVEVSLGFESGSPAVLKAMNKRFTPAEVHALSDLLADYGIRRMGFLLLGGPGETRATVEESLAFARSLRLDALKTTVGIRIYPGTPLEARARDEGLLAPGQDLLRPAFYLAPGLEPWIHERLRAEGL